MLPDLDAACHRRFVWSARDSGGRSPIVSRPMNDDLLLLLRAADFAAHKHRDQRRKDHRAPPYINHPLEVARLLAEVGAVGDPEILAGAILHDTLEDTDTEADELETEFGRNVRRFVEEVSDDTSLPKAERKQLQIEQAPGLSPGAALIKIADKICNVRDAIHRPPKTWDNERVQAYLGWAEAVVARCPKVNATLERRFAEILATGLGE